MSIYLDNAATTRISDEVLDAMMPYLKDDFGNPGARYLIGRKASDAVDMAREQVANLLGADYESIIFTSGGSASNNLVIKGLAPELDLMGRKGLLISAVEHDSLIKAANSMIYDGFTVRKIPVEETGTVSVDNVLDNIMINTGLVSVMYVNNETGAMNPIPEIGKELHSRGLLFHTDCVQAAGNYEIKVDDLNCDYLSISSHKIHGPKGVGALFARDISTLRPLINGGDMQEFGLWGGTENVPGIVGFGKACEIAERDLIKTQKTIKLLKDAFYESLLYNFSKAEIGRSNIHINGEWYSHSKTVNLRFDNIDSETLLMALDAYGICVSSGSACRTYESKPSRVLLAMGLTPDEARNSIRISFSIDNTLEEVRTAASCIAKCVKVLLPQDEN